MPENTVYVGRPTKWGNPFTIKECREAGFRGSDSEIAGRVVGAFRAWLLHPHGRENWSGEEAGEFRRANRIERLLIRAHGHEDLQATHAARRLLQKRGIDWTQYTEKLRGIERDCA